MRNSTLGFTLIEAVVVIAITAIIATAAAVFVAGPMQTYLEAARRADLVQAGSVAMLMMTRDIRQAVPDSVRVKPSPGNYPALEFMLSEQALHYRASAPNGQTGVGQVLTFDSAVSNFDIIGSFSSSVLAEQANGDPLQIVIFNQSTDVAGQNSDNPLAGVNLYNTTVAAGAYPIAGSHVMTPTSTHVTLSNGTPDGAVILNPAHLFAFPSPSQRLYVVDMNNSPVTYLCDNLNGTIYRYWGYPIQSTQPNSPGSAPLSSPTTQNAEVFGKIQSCSFTYQPGTSQRNGIVTININLYSAFSQDVLPMVQQVFLENAP